ncbi:unnamed protein product [Boreogadus saida]
MDQTIVIFALCFLQTTAFIPHNVSLHLAAVIRFSAPEASEETVIYLLNLASPTSAVRAGAPLRVASYHYQGTTGVGRLCAGRDAAASTCNMYCSVLLMTLPQTVARFIAACYPLDALTCAAEDVLRNVRRHVAAGPGRRG